MNERRVHQIFQASVLIKGAHAIVECVGGLVLAVVSTDTIGDLINRLTQDELIEDRNDFIATHLRTMAEGISIGTKQFYALYLLSHGVVKVFLVVGLLRNKLWSYPVSLIVIGLFVVYQLYRYSYTRSVGLLVITVFDLFVIALIWNEYRLIRRHRPVE